MFLSSIWMKIVSSFGEFGLPKDIDRTWSKGDCRCFKCGG